MKISIIIRTLNPHRPTLARVFEGLRRQTFPLAQTELLIVDNASQPPLDAATLGLAWHPNARVVREPTRGKIMAQRCGVRAASPDCDLVLLVDDDNVLREDYLETGARLAEEFRQLGAWGSGSIKLHFDQPPPASLSNLSRVLTTWKYPYDVWSSLRDLRAYSVPAGAGMFVRRAVADHWADTFDASPMRRALFLHENPPILFSEDTDLALTAPDMGLGTGIFPSLHIDHLVRAEKVSAERLLRLIENQQIAEAMIYAIRGLNVRTRFQRWRKVVNDHAKLAFLRGNDRRAHWHLLRGRARGERLVREYLAVHPEERPVTTPQPWLG